MIKVHLIPSMDKLPQRGGVREHLIQLHKQLLDHPDIKLVKDPEQADLYHVESSWFVPNSPMYPKKPMVYVCHGGFVPSPIPTVMNNLHDATMIITVADWLASYYFPQYAGKTVHIPNGVDLKQLDDYQKPNQLGLTDYVLYGKEWDYHTQDLLDFAALNPTVRFVTTTLPGIEQLLPNMTYVGLQSHPRIISLLKHARCLLLTGSEVCPTMLLEAWAVGCPVIAKDLHGAAELMRLQQDTVVGGMLYNRPSRGVVQSVADRREEFGRQGREQVELAYQWPQLIKKYVDVYKQVLS